MRQVTFFELLQYRQSSFLIKHPESIGCSFIKIDISYQSRAERGWGVVGGGGGGIGGLAREKQCEAL